MDFDLLPQLIIVISIAGILFIVGRNFSKVKEATKEEIFLAESAKEKEEKEKFLYLYKRAVRRINKENYQKKMADFWLWLEKLLRKLRILVMKIDGKMVRVLERLRQKNTESIENWKQMAERNVRKSKEAEMLSGFLAGGAYRKHHKEHKEHEEPQKADIEAEEEEIKSQMSAVTVSDDAYTPIVEQEIYEDRGTVERFNPYDDAAAIQKEEQSDEIAVKEEIESVGYAAIEEMTVIESVEDPEPLPKKEIAEMEVSDETVPEEQEETTDTQIEEEKVEEDGIIQTIEDGEIETEEEEKLRTKKEQECIEILMKNPADIKAYWRLGLIYSKRRNYEDALACFRQIVKIDPTYTKAKQKAIELMEKMKKRGK